MRKKILKTPLFLLLVSTSTIQQLHAIPAVDVPEVVSDVFGQIKATYTQLVTWKREIEQWKQQYAAITEFKLGDDFLKDFNEINDFLGKNGLDMSDIDIVNPKSQIAKMAKSMFDKYSVFNDCNFDFMDSDQKRLCMDTIVREAQEVETLNKFSEKVTKAMEKLNDLNGQISTGAKSSKKTSEAPADGGFDMDDFSENMKKSKEKASDQSDYSSEIIDAILELLDVDESDGSFSFDDFSEDQQGFFDTVMSQFSDALGMSVDSDENTIKKSNDIGAGIKSVSTTLQSLKAEYMLLKIKNNAKRKLDRRRKKQIYMKKLENTTKYYKGEL